MALTLSQRLDRIRVRLDELRYWREREAVQVAGWSFEGAPIEVGASWPSSTGAVTLAAQGRAPEHWPIAESRLVLDPGGEALVSLSYEGGETVRFGCDPYHLEFPIRRHAFSINVEAVARRPFGEPVREPRLAVARLCWIDTAVSALHLRLAVLTEACAELEGHDVVPHLVAAGEEALRALDWPSASADYIARFAQQAGQQRIWQLPLLKDSPPGLDESQRASVMKADLALIDTLRGLQKRYPPIGELVVCGHAHIDLAWLWPYAETRRKTRRTFHTALSLMEGSSEYLARSGFRFSQSSAQYYAQIEEDDPALFAQIVAKAKAGAWETIGGMWVEPDTNMPTGESLTRQLLYGQRYFEQKFGVRHRVCWLPDCFGFSAALPQLLKQAGIESFFTIKVNWNETNKFPYDLFWWEGLDGSRVLAHTFDNPAGGYNGAINPKALHGTWQNFRGKAVHRQSLLTVGHGDGGGGVTPEFVEREMLLRDFPALPTARWGRVDEYFARAHQTAAKTALPSWQGEIYLERHRGTLTTQSAVKRLHRQAERALITAEALGAMAALMGGAMPDNLEHIWRIVLKNAFHDILPGSSIAEVYEDAQRELGEVVGRALARQQMALKAMVARLPDGDVSDAVVVVNPSLMARPLRLRLPDGSQFSAAEIVAPMSVKVHARSDLEPAPGLSVGPNTLENAHLRVTLGEDGTIASLIHKATGREALAGPGNQLWVYPQDKPRNWDAWDIEDDYRASGIALTQVSRTHITAEGPHRAAITVIRKFRNSTITQTYALEANGTRLDIETSIDWRDRHCLLRTLTPVDVRTSHATFEHANGVVRRTTHDNTSWDQAQFEVPGHRFCDLSETGFGVALLNDAKYGHSAKGNVLGLSLVRSPVYPDPLADEGGQRFTYALYPHAGDWHAGRVREEAEDLNQPLCGETTSGVHHFDRRLIAVDGIDAALSGLKLAEDGNGLILRVFEPAGRRGPFGFDVPPGWEASGPLSILEEPMAREDGVALKPFEVRTWRLTKTGGA